MGHSHDICPYKSISEDDKIFEFGMTPQQIVSLDAKIFETKEYNAAHLVLERRGGYSTEFIDSKLVAVAFRIDPGHNSFKVAGVDISDRDGVERLKSSYEHYVFSDGESILFPTLGFLVSITPFCEGWETPRLGVFNREIIAFSQERLPYYRSQAHVISLLPMKGIYIAGQSEIQFTMPPEDVHKVLGEPDFTWKNFGSHKHIVEYYEGSGFSFRYRGYEASYQYHADMPLYTVDIMEKNEWQVEVDGIRIFMDDKLVQMKSCYEHIESKKKKAVAFPTLGIFSLGCGEKKNKGKGAEGKVVFLCNSEVMASHTRFIDMWD